MGAQLFEGVPLPGRLRRAGVRVTSPDMAQLGVLFVKYSKLYAIADHGASKPEFFNNY
ncbi:hypothetical protein D3OALGA1CA_3813 [Olavius algarvensis associated proteobacterium Delta 3]|nr:hypothetical protein D3OALGA1CA_3813 [Olavius algarvensis associated proteobacterium Delta 3]CAB5150443.1 hypothetical protein D3OALGB2SA_4771 [Olavius algarvensis associated proteobacterium Delta 3]